MKIFNQEKVRYMARRNGTPFVYKPFPGKYPIRVSVRIQIQDMALREGRWWTRMDYNGQWSYPILRKALRVWNQIALQQTTNGNLIARCEVVEYCQTGVVYIGDLFFGTYSQGHAMSHLFHNSSKGSIRINGDYRIEKMVPVRCGDFSMMVPESQMRLAVTREQKNILYEQMRKSRKRWEAV